MSARFTGFAFLFIFYCSALWAEEITIFGSDDYPPISFRNEQGQFDGIAHTLIKHYEQLSGHKVTLEMASWKHAYLLAEQGKGGIIGLSKTKSRLAIFDYSDPFYDSVVGLLVKKGKEFSFNSVADLKGKLISVTNAASYGAEFDTARAAQLFKVDINYAADVQLNKLLYDLVDCVVVSHVENGIDLIVKKDPELLSKRDQFVYLRKPLVRDPVYLAFHKSMKMKAYIVGFNHAIKDAKQKGLIPR
ncbi:substrate-binding periplasmic protein [Iodobacter ciconiae]|uniref:Transporter substrate-binding domain-containing protein n=1 Tax=Iodobacter ciconiae TaxID=2496266 RepID=A0A3S8ZQ85_9NEIS|nr:transporter substrate-binding domain-containing protein [Iodobacter ciconiae]AZN35628.1 transporter substrate-binding domain-containing protein [Iodobacter ciconiae]